MKFWICNLLFWFLISQLSFAQEDDLSIGDYSYFADGEEPSAVSYNQVADSVLLVDYIQLLTSEISKYPSNYFDRIGIKQIVLGKNLTLEGQVRAAIPYPSLGILYINVDEKYGDEYIVHVFHHELHHCTEFSLWSSMFYPWEKWDRRNIDNFQYGEGGAHAYKVENESIDWYTPNHPAHGFVNLYAMLGQEEDRCEIVALIMCDTERDYLLDFAAQDKCLYRKVKLILKLLDKVSTTKVNYWQKKMRTIGKG